MKLYIDTNIYLDYLMNRRDSNKNLGDLAFKIFNRTIRCEFHIIISTHVINELRKYNIPDDRIKLLFNFMKHKLIKTNSKEYEKKAELVKEIHFADALHYVISLDKADLLVTNDKELKKLARVVGYEDL